jgi:hypothetical protein
VVLNPDKTFALTHSYAAAGAYTVTVTVTDKDGGVGHKSIQVHVTEPARSSPPATVQSVSSTGGTTRHPAVQSVILSFSRVLSLLPGAVELLTRKGRKMKPIAFKAGTITTGEQTNIALIFTGRRRGLPDGNYTLILHADKIRDAQGTPLDGDADGVAGGDWTRRFGIVRGRWK